MASHVTRCNIASRAAGLRLGTERDSVYLGKTRALLHDQLNGDVTSAALQGLGTRLVNDILIHCDFVQF